MADREKVIKAIETHLSTDISVGCDDCTYENDGWCTTRLLADILHLLKEQEPMKPKNDKYGFPHCPKCNFHIYQIWSFCPHCGQAVKQDD